eukprot:TRINITY_DN2630_c0_g1_i1.p1 TRINITY_DN2630_c0_g1~~TRINITY_DN2630_c0_g1_i1.p1  ORF type:complete len:1069 (-),score=433.22 TRINITY_DN2630_c0_g1_i1:162-3368(-)
MSKAGELDSPSPRRQFSGASSTRDLTVSQNADGTVHTYTNEERAAIVEHINGLLANDEFHKPIDPESDEIFEAVKDGILICKIINAVQPGTIGASLINIKDKLNRFEVTENHVTALRFARQLGLRLVNMGPTDFMEGNQTLVLGILWQLVRLDLLSKVLKIKTEFIEEDETPSAAEEILIKWFNFNLKKANHHRTVSNFGSDIKDSENYIVLMHQLAPTAVSRALLVVTNLELRAEQFLESCKTINCAKFINPTDIIKGNVRLNTAFVAHLFTVFNKPPPAPAAPAVSAEPAVDETEIPFEGEDEIAFCEREIQRLNEIYKKTERENQIKEEIIKEAMEILEKEAEKLHQDLEKERIKNSTVSRDTEISALQSKLKQLQRENKGFENESDVRAKIEAEHQAKLELVAQQRLLEGQVDDLKEDLEDKESVRRGLEVRYKRLEEETRKMQLRHMNEMDRLRKRLNDARSTEDKLATEFEDQLSIKEEAEDRLYENRRIEKKVTTQLRDELSSKERIENTRRRLENELKKAESNLSDQMSLTNNENRIRTKLTKKVEAIQQRTRELKNIKTDLQITTNVLEEQVEDVKDELADEELKLMGARNLSKQLNKDVTELEEELENASDEKLDAIRRKAQQDKMMLAKLTHNQEKEAKRAEAPLRKLKEEIQETNLNLVDEEHRQSELKTAIFSLEGQQQNLGTQLFEENMAILELAENGKKLDRDLLKTDHETEEQKKMRREAEANARRAGKEARKAGKDAMETAADREQLERDMADLEHETLLGKIDLQTAQTRTKNLKMTTNSLEKELENHKAEIEEENSKSEKLVQGAKAKTAEEISRAERAQARLKARGENSARDLEEKASSLEESLEKERHDVDRLSSSVEKKDRERRRLEKRLSIETQERISGQKAKEKLEEEIDKAKSLMKDRRHRSSSTKDKELKSSKSAKKTSALLHDLDAANSELADGVRELQMKVEEARATLSENAPLTSSKSARSILEAQLAEFTKEFDGELDSKKSKLKSKHASTKDELKKKSKREKEKLEKGVKAESKKREELLEQLEEERRAKEAIAGNH